jgi:predicted enzyme related to lactoylglutathione lyase
MKAIEIAFTCYPVTSLKKSRKFYEEVLELKPTSVWVKDDKNGMIEYDIGPGTFAIGAGSDSFKVVDGGASAAIEVDDFKTAMKELKDRKCKFVVEPMDTSVCHMAIIADPDGNKLMIHKRTKK